MSKTVKQFISKQRAPSRFVLLIVFGLVVIGGLLISQIVRAEGRVLPNVYVGGVNIGNKTLEEAREKLESALRVMNLTGLEFIYEDKSLSVKAGEKGAGKNSGQMISYDIDGMIEKAYSLGNRESRGGLAAANIKAFFSKTNIPVIVGVRSDDIKALLKEKFGDFESDARGAEIAIKEVKRYSPSEGGSAEDAVATPRYKVDITPEIIGKSFDYEKAVTIATAGLSSWRGGTFQLDMMEETPIITKNKAELVQSELIKAREKDAMTMAYDDKTWLIRGETFANAITLKAHNDGSLYVGLRPETILPILDKAAEEIEQEPKSTRLVANEDNTRAIEFEGGQVGRKLGRETNMRLLDEKLADAESSIVPLTVEITAAPDSDALAEELGIRELLGYGTSDFTGSPQNRRKNIKNGVDKLNGWIIAPGDEFGLIGLLGPFTAAGGYVQELVIKENRTIKEYGGGLCQIGTTAFRAVMNSGLPITQRQSHSFRVRYYEPVGTDATLYDPAPDFRFKNDTGNYVIFVTRMFENQLRFELWGTRDGRVQNQSKVTIFSETPPPPAKLIPTSALPEGEKKCFEKPQKGARTSFTYTITYIDGRVDEQEYRSSYKPWQEQCLIGEPGAPNIKLMWDGAIKEFPPESGGSA